MQGISANPAPHIPALSQKKSLIVEVGHGDAPIWRTLRNLPLTDQTYLGLDIRASVWPSEQSPTYGIDRGRNKILERMKSGRDCHFMFLDGSGTLPVPDGRASEVYYSLIFSDPRIFPSVIHKLLEETARITCPQGRVVVDNNSPIIPDFGDVLVDWARGRLVFKQNGGHALSAHDNSNLHTEFLNDIFEPMAGYLYPDFLSERGLPPHYEINPGYSMTVMVKR